jgi:hypothetical protein
MSSPVITVSSIIEDAKALSFADLLALQASLATLVKGEFKKVSKGAKGAKVVDPSKPKRKLSQGVVIWQAFVKHLFTSQPDLFEGAKVTQRQTIAKEYRAAHPDEYESFKADFEAPVAEAEAPVESEAEEEEESLSAAKAKAKAKAPGKGKGRPKKATTA